MNTDDSPWACENSLDSLSQRTNQNIIKNDSRFVFYIEYFKDYDLGDAIFKDVSCSIYSHCQSVGVFGLQIVPVLGPQKRPG